MVFEKYMARLLKLTTRKAGSMPEKDEISTETQTTRGKHEDLQFNVNVERAKEQRPAHLKRLKVKNVLLKTQGRA